ncbi:MAG TPA: WXG100 family type VII secretion target [Spirochaetales bacterium]|nr:WXG100 family type VII secretion target [Spirochaetales bacterium]
MAGTEVLTGRMLEIAKRVEDIVGRYNNSVSKLYQIGGEIDAMWDGEAGNKFMATLGSDRERFNALTKMLTMYVETLRQDAAIYAKAESDALNILSTNKAK